MKPSIEKLGTIDCDLVETNPVVFKERLYRFEYVRDRYAHNHTGASYFRFVEHDTRAAGPPFAHGYHLGCAFVEGDVAYVTCVDHWDGEHLILFRSDDLEHWDQRPMMQLPGYGLFNTSLCRGGDGYVLMFEVGRPPEVAGRRFTARFATSTDMERWELTAPECTYSKDRYTAPHCLRYHDGFYYDFYLEAHEGYEQRVVRSNDLIHWEASPHNPVLRASDDDRAIVTPALTVDERQRVAIAENINNSDIDFCEYQGRVVINYSWGNQRGIEHLAEAVFHGSLEQFLTGWYE